MSETQQFRHEFVNDNRLINYIPKSKKHRPMFLEDSQSNHTINTKMKSLIGFGLRSFLLFLFFTSYFINDTSAQCIINSYVPSSLQRVDCNDGGNVWFRVNYTIGSQPIVTWQYNDDDAGNLDALTGYQPVSGSSISHLVNDNYSSAFARLDLLSPGLAYVGYKFRASFSGVPCSPTLNSNAFTYILNGPVSITGQPSSVALCETSTSTSFSVTGYMPPGASGTMTYLWQSSPDGNAPWTNVPSSNNATLNVSNSALFWPAAGSLVHIRARVSVSGCGNVFSDIVTLQRDIAPTIMVSDDVTICASSTTDLTATFGGSAGSVTWSGAGTFSNVNANPVTYNNGTPGTYTLTATTNSNACGAATDQVIVNVSSQLPATVNAGADQEVCAGNTITLAGIIGGPFSTGMWSATSGSFSDANSLSSSYTPSLSSGTVQLILTSYDPPGLCGPVTDTMIVTINSAVTVNVGADASICNGDSILVTAAMTGSVSTGTWSGGTGAFSNASMTSTYFTPSANGSMTLTFTSTAGVCASVSDNLTLTVNEIVGTGTATTQTVCAGGNTNFRKNRTTFPASPGGSINTWYYDDGTGWVDASSLADVTFTNTSAYTQINLSAVNVNWNTYGFRVIVSNGMCQDTFDGYKLYVNTPATANAGIDTTICSSATFTLPTTPPIYGGGATSGTWKTVGTGTFDSGMYIYTPSADDITSGSVKLYVKTNDPSGPCPVAVDTMLLSIDTLLITGYSPSSKLRNICEGSNTTFRVNYTSSPAASVVWEYRESSSGAFADASALGTISAPSGNTQFNIIPVPDTTYNGYEFRAVLTAGYCKNIVSDTFSLIVGPSGTVEAGSDIHICEIGGNTTLNGSFTGGYASATWTEEFPVGSPFGNTMVLNTSYTPDPSLAGTTVKLYLTTNNPTGGCPAKKDSVYVIVPSGISAGPDANVCHNASITLTGASIASPVTSATWTTSGDGGFSDALGVGAATYTPGPSDKAAGMVTLTLTSNNDPDGSGVGCTNYFDKRVLTVENLVFTAYSPATKAVSTCDGQNVELSVTTNSVTPSTFQWMKASTSAGPYTIVSTDSLYSFSAVAADSGYVYKVEVTPSAGCGAVSDTFKVNVNGPITVSTQPINAGTVCNSATATFTAAASANVTPTLQWQYSTTLAGTYADISGSTSGMLSLDKNSTPAWPALGGTVYLRMKVSIADCSAVYTDIVSLTVDAVGPAVVNAGVDMTRLCNDPSKEFTLSGSLGGSSTSAIWSLSSSSTGGGTFVDPNFLGTTYTLTNAQMFAGGVDLVLTSNDPSGVCPVVSDTMKLILTPGVIDAGLDQTVCSVTSPVAITGASLEPFLPFSWAGTGGTFNSTSSLDPTYTPSGTEVTDMIATLTLTRTATSTCPSISDTKVLNISNVASITAGGDQTVCFGSPVTLAGNFTTMPATSITWSIASSVPTGLTGSFLDVNNPTTQFTPDAAGTYNLQITSNSGLPGACSVVSDQVVITAESISITGYSPTNKIANYCNSTSNPTNPIFIVNYTAVTTLTSTWEFLDGMSWTTVTGSNHPGFATTGSTSIKAQINFNPRSAYNGRQYRLTLARTSPNCQIISDTFTLYVPGTPVIANTATTPSSITTLCSSQESVVFPTTVTIAGVTPYDTIYRWEYNSATTGTFTPVPSSVMGYNTTVLTLKNGDAAWPAFNTSRYFRLRVTTESNNQSCDVVGTSRLMKITQQAPVSNAGADVSSCGTLGVTLAGSFSGTATSASWTSVPACPSCFTDPNFVGTTFTPTGPIASLGSVDVILTTNDPGGVCGVDKDTMTITIGNGAVTATNPAGPLFTRTVCDGANATFSVDYSSPSTQAPTSVVWEYYNGSVWAPIVGSSVAHTFPTYATGSSLRLNAVDRDTQNGWDIRCTVTYPGCSATVNTFDLIINEGPTIVSTGAPYAAVCAMDTIALDGAVGGTASKGYWSVVGTNGDDLNITYPDPDNASATYTPNAADVARGYIIVQLKSENVAGPCPAVTSAPITIMIHEISGVTISGNQVQCAGETVVFSASWLEDDLTLDSTITWQMNDGTGWATASGTVDTSHLASTLTFNAVANTVPYQVRAIIHSGACTDTTLVRTLTVNGPVVFTAHPTSVLNVCQNVTEQQFTAAATNNGTGTIAYMWQYSNNGTTGWTNVPATETSRTNDTLTITQVNGGAAWPVIGNATGKYYRLSAYPSGCSAGYYTSNAAQFTISNDAAPVANAGADVTLCSNTSYIFADATIGGSATSATWTHNGAGSIDNPAALASATYTPGAGDAGQIVTFTLTTNTLSCGANVDTKTITYQNVGTVNAGLDINRCLDGTEGDAFLVTATTTGGITGGTWSSPSGTFTDASMLSTMFTPTVTIGTITLTFTGTTVCPATSDNVSVIFNPNITITTYSPAAPYTTTAACSDGELVTLRVNHLSLATIQRTWQSSTDGMTWTDLVVPSTDYTSTSSNATNSRLNITTNPSILDSTRYRVILSNGACLDTSETFIVRINHSTLAPLADVNICATETTSKIGTGVTSTGTAAVNLLWQYHIGSGWTSMPNTVAGYNTDTLRMDSGDALWANALGSGLGLRLRVYRPGNTCVFYSDSIQFSRGAAVTVFAGVDADGCSNSPVSLTPVVTGPGMFTWNDGGLGGSFSQSSSLTGLSTYSNSSPGTYSLALLSEDPLGACEAVKDTVKVTIHEVPTVTLGADVTVCMSSGATPVSLTGTLGGSAASGMWMTTGTGTFGAIADVNTTYTPSAGDIAAQYVKLVYTTNGNTGCMGAKDSINLTIGNGIILSLYTPGAASAGTRTVCTGGNTSFTVAYDATVTATHQWQVNKNNTGWVNLPINASAYGIGGWSTTGTDMSTTLNLTGLTMGNLQFQVIVTDRGCSQTFGAFTLNVNGPVTFTTQPASASVCATANSANFTAIAVNSGSGVLTYRWQYNSGSGWVDVPISVGGYNGPTLYLTDGALGIWPDAGLSVDLKLNATIPLCGTTSSNIVTLTHTNVPCESLADLVPTNFVTSGSGITANQSTNIVMRVLNTGSVPTSGIVQFRVYKMGTNFSVEFDNSLPSILVGFVNIPVSNTMWTIDSSNAVYHTITSNAPMVINPTGFMNVGLTITATGNVGQMSTLRQQITPGTGGGESPTTNNNKTLVFTIN